MKVSKWILYFKKKIFDTLNVIAICMLTVVSLGSQEEYLLRDATRPLRIPFDYYNNFVVINVNFEGLPLRFIVDTGAEHTIILQKEITDLLRIDYDRRVRLMGADLSEELYGYTVSGASIKIGEGGSILTNIVVLEDNFLNLDNLIGLDIHGILGSNVLKHFVTGFDFRSGYITLSKHEHFKGVPGNFDTIPLTIYRNKPYVKSQLTLSGGEVIDANLLMDTGASLSLLLYESDRNKIKIPEQYITGSLGLGLGGNILGFMGRIEQMKVGDFTFENLVSNFQRIGEMDSVLIQRDRHGIVGNVILSKFTLIIDYQKAELYVKPNRNFKKKIRYDKSGLVIVYAGDNLNTLMILDVIEGSPAFKAGLQPGDRIIKFRGWPAKFFTMQGISKRLSAKAGRKVSMTILRNDEKEKYRFKLRDLI